MRPILLGLFFLLVQIAICFPGRRSIAPAHPPKDHLHKACKSPTTSEPKTYTSTQKPLPTISETKTYKSTPEPLSTTPKPKACKTPQPLPTTSKSKACKSPGKTESPTTTQAPTFNCTIFGPDPDEGIDKEACLCGPPGVYMNSWSTYPILTSPSPNCDYKDRKSVV